MCFLGHVRGPGETQGAWLMALSVNELALPKHLKNHHL